MALSFKARRRWSLAILLIGLPVYIVVALIVVTWFGDLPVLVELLVYLALGLIWALPFRGIFRGIAQPDPKHRD